MKKTTEHTIKRAPRVQKKQEAVIRVSRLKKTFGNKEVLKEMTINVKKGENVVVLGKSGSGKSVLIKCIVRLIDPDGGELNVLGKDVLTLNHSELDVLRKKIGFLFQSAALYDSMTVRENLEFPLRRTKEFKYKREVDRLVLEALENVGLKEAIHKMPDELSGGMRKRIGLARTLILKPEIMLYDEPTTGLDPVTAREISMLIIEMQKKYNISSIIITHDMSCARITSDRILIIHDGQFIAEGTYDELEKSKDPFVSSFFKTDRER